MPVQQHVLNWLYSVLTSEYHDVNRTYNDVAQALSRYPGLSPRTDVHTFPNGTSALLLHLSGTVPVAFRGATYRFPISIWVPHAYPREPPIAYVTPTENIVVRPGQHVDPQGQIYHPYLNHWPSFWDKSTILDFLAILTDVFAKETPVVSRQQQQQQQQQQPPFRQPAQENAPPPLPPLPPEMASGASPALPSLRTTESPLPQPPPRPPPGPMPDRPGLGEPVNQPQRQPPRDQQPSGPPPRLPPTSPPGTPKPGTREGIRPPAGQPHPRPISRYESAPPLPPPMPPPADSRLSYASLPASVRPGITVPGLPPPSRTPAPPYNPGSFGGFHLVSPQPTQSPPPQPPPPQGELGYRPPIPSAPSPQPAKPPPPTNLLDEPLPLPAPTPAPPVPPNPRKDALIRQLGEALYLRRRAGRQQDESSLAGLAAQRVAMQQAMATLQSELGTLNQLSALLASNTNILHEALRKADAVVEGSRSHPAPDTDELLVAPTVVANQLYALVADERALGDAIFVVGRAMEKGRVSPAVFAKTVRSLAREWYLKKALVHKIGRGMGLAQ